MPFATKTLLSLISLMMVLSLPGHAYEAGDFIVRGGAALVDPQDDSSLLSLNGSALSNTGIGVGNDMQLGITATYMVTKNIGIGLLASTPFTHDLQAKGSTLKGLGLDGTIGEVKHLPPTLSAQYFFDTNSKATPYVGIGVNYTIMLEDSLDNEAENALGSNKIDLDDSVGLALEAGVDVQLTDNLLFNAAVWRIDIDTEATIDDTNLPGDLKVDVDIDPWVYMVGLGYKF